MNTRKLGIAVVGIGGAVGTTMVAGIELLKKKKIGTEGLPLADLDAKLIKDLADYENIIFGDWDLHSENLAAAEEHDVLTHKQFVAVEEDLRKIKLWRAVGNKSFLENIEGEEVGVFFKFPMTREKDAKSENALHKQENVLLDWLEN